MSITLFALLAFAITGGYAGIGYIDYRETREGLAFVPAAVVAIVLVACGVFLATVGAI